MTMLGILPDQYFTDLRTPGGTPKEIKKRWAQTAGASETLSDHAMDILKVWLEKTWKIAETADEERMAWYHTNREAGYQ